MRNAARLFAMGFGIAWLLAAATPRTTASNDVNAPQSCPATPVVTTTSPDVPTDVCIPSGFRDNPIDYFDDFSWRAFVAMVWPVQPGQRGMPDRSKLVTDAGPRVFETFKPEWEVFRANGAAPSGWNDIDQDTPCGNTTVAFGDVVLASFSKFGNLGQAGPGTGALIHALPAQNKTWLRYLTGFDRLEYEQIVADKLYLRDRLDRLKPVKFRDGAIDVKSAWMDISGVANASRYYTRAALAFDPVSGACRSITVALVGLHIVIRTPSRPQWIWSTFEHIDNVPPVGSGVAMALHDGSVKDMPKSDPNGGFPPADWAKPQVYNVKRVWPVHARTEKTNTAYRAAIRGVWQNYRLVMTQWPLQKNPPNPIPPTQSGGPANTFPGLSDAKTSFANTTMETWEQDRVTTGCMACHTATQATDFLWALEVHAFSPPPPPGAAIKPNATLQRLRSILDEAKKNAATRR